MHGSAFPVPGLWRNSHTKPRFMIRSAPEAAEAAVAARAAAGAAAEEAAGAVAEAEATDFDEENQIPHRKPQKTTIKIDKNSQKARKVY